MNKVVCFFKLLITVIQFKLSRCETDYWTWLFNIVSNKQKRKHVSKCLIMFLIADAHQRGDCNAVCDVYEVVCDDMSDDWPSKKGFKIILACSEKVNRKDLTNKILKIIEQREVG